MKIGILAIQGDFYLHKESFNKLNIDTLYVKNSNHLLKCDALVIPGGESTTMSLLFDKYSLFSDIKKFSQTRSLFGTCAGSILMSTKTNDKRIKNLKCLNLTVKRNAWGSQIHSFSDKIIFNSSLKINLKKDYFATFIRAPKFYDFGSNCTVLGKYNNEPVLIRNNMHIISSFHPEMHNKNLAVYKYYLNMING